MSKKREAFVQYLKKELQTISNVKRFSQELRELGICDLRDDKQFENATKDGGVLIMTLISHFNFGFLNKMLEVKRKIHEES